MPNNDNSWSVYTLYMAIKRNIKTVHEERHVQSLTISWFCLNDRNSIFIICTIISMSAFPGSRLFIIYNLVFLPFLYACKITQDSGIELVKKWQNNTNPNTNCINSIEITCCKSFESHTRRSTNRLTFLFGKSFPFSRRFWFWQLKDHHKNWWDNVLTD